MEFSEIISVVSDDLELVEKELESSIQSPVPLVYEISKYLLGSGGKRLRPAVLLLASGACGLTKDKERIYGASALELVHTASLLHDDVVDEATLRRGKPSSNIVWGNKPTVLVGDFMLGKALSLIQACQNLEVVKSITDAAAMLAEGQVLEVMSSNSMVDMTEDICFGIIKNKTASLLQSCGAVGAILADAGPSHIKSLGDYGLNIGIAFQLTDDALDYSSTEQEFGKAVGQDLIEGKMTLPLFYSIQKSSKSEKAKVNEIIAKEGEFTDDELHYVREIVRNYQGVKLTNDMAESYIEKAIDSISTLADSDYKNSLNALAEYIVERRT
ncbi:MAG: polyprenyl synthetase family protein [Thermodesulfobacteriota bacterium]